MKSKYIYFLSLVMASVAMTRVAAASDTNEQKVATEILKTICDQERGTFDANGYPDKLKTDFYSCIQCCQGMHPFQALDDPAAIARQKLTGDRAFDRDTQKALCGDPTVYAGYFKNAVIDVKGPLKYNTPDEISAFYDQKADCFKNCEVSPTPQDKKDCIPFKPDPNVRVCHFEKGKGRKPNLGEILNRQKYDQVAKDALKGIFKCRTIHGTVFYRADSATAPRSTWRQAY